MFLSLHHTLSEPITEYRVRLDPADPLDGQQPQGSELCALSPIFPVAKAPYLPNADDSYEIAFAVHRDPFSQIAKLPPESHSVLWVSLGIAALIAVTPAGQASSGFLSQLDLADVLCTEVWTIHAGILAAPPQVAFSNPTIPDLRTGFPKQIPDDPDTRRVVRELLLNFAALAKRSRLIVPSFHHTVEAMLVAANRETSYLINAASNLSASTKATSESSPGVPVQDYLISHKQLNLSLDNLVQLNSGLAYIISQTFYGGLPLLQNRALNSCHSLLGVGTAIRAIQSFANFIIEGFAEHPLALILEHHLKDVTLSTHLARPAAVGTARTIDHYTPRVGRSEQTPKLAYFSTRMGFSEHAYCVTAATQCLASADTARRNLLTLTHELLHSHVKGLLATTLALPTATHPDDSHILRLVREYKQLYDASRTNPECQRDWEVLKFLRYRIFQFADGIHTVLRRFQWLSDRVG